MTDELEPPIEEPEEEFELEGEGPSSQERSRQERLRALADELAARSEAREEPCLELSEISELVQDAELDDEDAQTLQDMLEARGGGERADSVPARRARPADDRRHVAVPAGGAPPPAAHPRAGGRAGQADRTGRFGRQGPAGQLQPAAGDRQRAQVPGPRSAPARPDPGGDPGADPGRREVRLAQGLQVLHLRDLLDPPGSAARAG